MVKDKLRLSIIGPYQLLELPVSLPVIVRFNEASSVLKSPITSLVKE